MEKPTKSVTKRGLALPSDPKPADVERILEERARLLAITPESKADFGETLEVQTFTLGNERLGIPTGIVQDIQPLRAHQWTRVPCVPAFIAGIVNLRGRIYSIMDLAAFWGLPPRPITENSHILRVKGVNRSDGQEIEITILTDECAEVEVIMVDRLEPPPSTVSRKMQSYIKGVTPDMMLIIDLESLLSDPSIIVSEGE